MLLDRIGPPGRCSGCWRRPRRSQLRGAASPRADRPSWLGGASTSFFTRAPAREVFLNSQCRRDAARPDRAAWAVQRLLTAAATLSATGSASPRPDRTSWRRGGSGVLSLRHFGLVLFIPWRVGAEESGAAKNGFGGAMLLDRLGPPGLRGRVNLLYHSRARASFS